MIQAVETALASGSALCYQELQEVPEPVASSSYSHEYIVGHGGALIEWIAFNRRVVGSTPALAAM